MSRRNRAHAIVTAAPLASRLPLSRRPRRRISAVQPVPGTPAAGGETMPITLPSTLPAFQVLSDEGVMV
ncbi:MAG: hypothetical protein AAFN17_03050, partial [Pseudomonadota bacterium]